MLNNESTHLKRIKTRDNYYLYNSDTSEILKINQKLDDILENVWSLSKNSFISYSNNEDGADKVYDYISEFSKRFVRQDIRKKKIEILDNIEQNSIYKPDLLTVNVTDNCNFRCKYCIYGENYNHTKDLSNENMTFETANKVLGWIKKIYTAGDMLTIGFYGGEPCLNFDLIKYFVEEINKIDLDIEYHFTTNGSVMTKAMQDFIVENNLRILVTVDGPKEMHNKNRVDLCNQPTYDKVMNNIKLFQKRYPDFCKERLNFVSTIETTEDYLELMKYRENNPEYKLKKISMIVCKHDERVKFAENREYYENLSNEYKRSRFDNLLERVISKRLDFFDDETVKNLLRIHFRKNSYRKGGICLDTEDGSLMVTTNGDFYVCEKMDHSFRIGNVDSWVNRSKIKSMLQKFFDFKEKYCSNCWIKEICSLCYAHFALNDEFKPHYYNCNSEKDSYEYSLMLYLSILEKLGERKTGNLMEFYNNSFK